ncbi:MAG: hypothetical protein KIPDCIKN_03366 [Haliscomenobacter sp.]|nr:hypothetical protein [Haliscomenobacter sp.]
MKTAPCWILLGILSLSCSVQEREEYSIDLAYAYFPLRIGEIRLFAQDSLVFDPAPSGTRIDSTRTYVMEILRDTLRDLSGNPYYRIERYERKDSVAPWKLNRVATERLDGQRLVRTEDNLPLVKMIFPLFFGQTWNALVFVGENRKVEVAGETLEMFKGWSPRIEEFDAPFSYAGKTYASTLGITVANFDSKIELRHIKERYAKEVGLVYRELFILDTQCIAACQNQTWEKKAEKGFILREWRLN